MKNPLYRKLTSKKGASLSVALLLFMVCAVLGSVVLKAGTAAAGRLADLARSDARYYGVTSAAEYLAEAITQVTDSSGNVSPRTVTVTRIHTTDTERTYTTNLEDGTMNITAASPVHDYSLSSVVDNASSETAITILSSAASEYLKLSGEKNQAWFDTKTSQLADDKTYVFYLDVAPVTGTTGTISTISVKVFETLKKNGDLLLTVSTVDGGDPYMVEMTFVLNASTRDANRTVAGSPVRNADGTSFTQNTTDKVTRTTVLAWDLAEIRKVNYVANNVENVENE